MEPDHDQRSRPHEARHGLVSKKSQAIACDLREAGRDRGGALKRSQSLRREGWKKATRRQVGRILRRMGLAAIYRRLLTSVAAMEAAIYPYLLLERSISAPDEVWCGGVVRGCDLDTDGNTEDRSDTVSVFNCSPPVIRLLTYEDEEIQSVSEWLAGHSKADVLLHEFEAFVRSPGQHDRAQSAVKASGLPFRILDEHVETTSGHV